MIATTLHDKKNKTLGVVLLQEMNSRWGDSTPPWQGSFFFISYNSMPCCDLLLI